LKDFELELQTLGPAVGHPLAHQPKMAHLLPLKGAGDVLCTGRPNLKPTHTPQIDVHHCCCCCSLQTMRLYKWPALRLAFVPGIIEALYDAGLATALFKMPFTLALSLGFILKAVGPGLVVPAMFNLQQLGWGAAKGIPSTVVIAASFDDIIAITGFSIFINIAISGSEDAAWQIASGPLQVGGGG
jgi:hypothetical protein